MTSLIAKPCTLIALALLCAMPALANTPTNNVVGWVEDGLIQPGGIPVKVKMDTGALTSSLHAEGIERFEKNGDKWVRFTVEVKNSKTGKRVSQVFERQIERNVKVRGAGGEERRPVVDMQICIGNKTYTEPFTLSDRGLMNYPVLIGRRTLAQLGLVDVSRTFTTKPTCSKETATR